MIRDSTFRGFWELIRVCTFFIVFQAHTHIDTHGLSCEQRAVVRLGPMSGAFSGDQHIILSYYSAIFGRLRPKVLSLFHCCMKFPCPSLVDSDISCIMLYPVVSLLIHICLDIQLFDKLYIDT